MGEMQKAMRRLWLVPRVKLASRRRKRNAAGAEAEGEDGDVDPATGLAWSGLKTSGTIGALLREGRVAVSDDDQDVQSADEEPAAQDEPVVSSPFEIGDDDEDEVDGELPIAEEVEPSEPSSGPAVPPWLSAGADDDDASGSPALNPIAEAIQKGTGSDADIDNKTDEPGSAETRGGDPGKGTPMMSIKDLANANREKSSSNELEFAESSVEKTPAAPASGDSDNDPSQPSGPGEGVAQGEESGAKPDPEPESPMAAAPGPLGLDEVVVAGTDAASTIKLTRMSDPVDARGETTPIAPLDSLPADNDVTKPILPPPANDDAPLEPLEDLPASPVQVSPLAPPPGLKPAAEDSDSAAAAKEKEDQAMLNLEPTSKGRFAKSEPTIVDGQDLDIPTLLRSTKKS